MTLTAMLGQDAAKARVRDESSSSMNKSLDRLNCFFLGGLSALAWAKFFFDPNDVGLWWSLVTFVIFITNLVVTLQNRAN